MDSHLQIDSIVVETQNKWTLQIHYGWNSKCIWSLWNLSLCTVAKEQCMLSLNICSPDIFRDEYINKILHCHTPLYKMSEREDIPTCWGQVPLTTENKESMQKHARKVYLMVFTVLKDTFVNVNRRLLRKHTMSCLDSMDHCYTSEAARPPLTGPMENVMFCLGALLPFKWFNWRLVVQPEMRNNASPSSSFIAQDLLAPLFFFFIWSLESSFQGLKRIVLEF